ncbi:hypothetical protein AS264_11960 [Enterococcus faecium]|uniref:hypothetical protein n=1 Tax=Enterococcus faecium TaxID=1352 RepID=UPI000763C87E|nr:hypothetical protein [Enterococcus faecium]KWZ14641.1 hypothetical protein AS264_11960 [Enterococcus faecium]
MEKDIYKQLTKQIKKEKEKGLLDHLDELELKADEINKNRMSAKEKGIKLKDSSLQSDKS